MQRAGSRRHRRPFGTSNRVVSRWNLVARAACMQSTSDRTSATRAGVVTAATDETGNGPMGHRLSPRTWRTRASKVCPRCLDDIAVARAMEDASFAPARGTLSNDRIRDGILGSTRRRGASAAPRTGTRTSGVPTLRRAVIPWKRPAEFASVHRHRRVRIVEGRHHLVVLAQLEPDADRPIMVFCMACWRWPMVAGLRVVMTPATQGLRGRAPSRRRYR